jgi:hypothetical protein
MLEKRQTDVVGNFKRVIIYILPYLIVIKSNPGLIRLRDWISGFMVQFGSIQINSEKLKKIKIFIFHIKKFI